MTLGENICRLRTARGMSQGDLAEALEVSRQSVSKWETNGATPDLDKLVKLSRLFGITLDELVKGEGQQQKSEPQSEPQVVYVERKEPAYPRRKVAGWVLFGLAFLVVLLCTLLGGILEGLILSMPLWTCGSICFAFQKRVGLWCSWAVFFFIDIYLRYATGLSWSFVHTIFYFQPEWNYMRLATAWGQLLALLGMAGVTLFVFRKWKLEAKRVVKIRLTMGVIAAGLLTVGMRILSANQDGFNRIIAFACHLLEWGRLGILIALLCAALAILRSRRQQRSAD